MLSSGTVVWISVVSLFTQEVRRLVGRNERKRKLLNLECSASSHVTRSVTADAEAECSESSHPGPTFHTAYFTDVVQSTQIRRLHPMAPFVRQNEPRT